MDVKRQLQLLILIPNGGGLKVFDMWKKLYDSGYFEDYGNNNSRYSDSILLRTRLV